jgi:hypothetical protein
MNVWCGLLYDYVIGRSYLAENAIKGKFYFGILELFAFPHFQVLESERKSSIVYQQNGTPLHKFRHALNAGFPNR